MFARPDTDPKNAGGFVIDVAIADVAHYVTPGSALDREALERGNSVYFPDRVVPMLPERISNDLCSLKPGVDRAAIAVRMVIGADGRKREHRFHRVLIRSFAKLHYAQAQAAIDGHPDDTTEPLLALVIEPLYEAYRALKRARDERGPLDLDLPERKILLKPDNTIDRVISPPRLDAHRLIEEFMILANVAAAERSSAPARRWSIASMTSPRWRSSMRCASSWRPSTSRCPRPARCGRKASTASSIACRGRDTEKLVNEIVLRSQAQAEYAAENYGHFGLNLRRYAHFTSPIRRYADLIVHRALIRALKLGDGGLPNGEDARSLGETAAKISAAERRAMAAERETVDRLIAHHLADRIGATFSGHIGGVTRSGLFVKLDDTGADGFIPAATIGNEYFRYNERAHALVGDCQRRDPPARRSRLGAPRRSRAGRRRAALRAAFGRRRRRGERPDAAVPSDAARQAAPRGHPFSRAAMAPNAARHGNADELAGPDRANRKRCPSARAGPRCGAASSAAAPIAAAASCSAPSSRWPTAARIAAPNSTTIAPTTRRPIS